MPQDYSIQNFVNDLNDKTLTEKTLRNRLRYLTNTFQPIDVVDSLKDYFFTRENLFDEIFFNKVSRKYEVIQFIIGQKLNLTAKQITWISQTKYLQNSEEERIRFRKLYNSEDKLKRLSINNLGKYTRDNKLAINSDPINRTMKVGVDYEHVDEDSRKWLDIYLDEWKVIREAVLTDIYHIFKTNPVDLISRAAEVSHTEKHNECEKTEVIDELTSKPKIFPIKSANGKDYIIYKLKYINRESGAEKTEYIASNGDKRPIKLTFDTKNLVYSIKKFSSTSLYTKFISPKYFSITPIKPEYKNDSFKGLKVGNIVVNLSSSNLRDTLGDKIAETVCSFLDKYYTSFANIDEVFTKNKKYFDSNLSFVVKSNNKFDLPELAERKYPTEKPDADTKKVYEYNAFVTEYNQFINEYIWQKTTDKSVTDNVKKLDTIKGVPSFPVIEKKTVRDYPKILAEIIHEFNKIRDKVQRVEVEAVDAVKLADWLSYKSLRSGKVIRLYFDNHKETLSPNEEKFDQVDIPINQAFRIAKDLLSYIEDKISSTKVIDLSSASPKEVREYSDLYAQYISIAAELVFDKKTREYHEFRIRFNTNTALLKASPFEDLKHEKNEISVSGFSVGNSIKKSFTLAFKEVGGKLRFYVIFNLHQSAKMKFAESAEFKAIAYEGEDVVIKPVIFQQNDGLCILPLSFGKRIGRRYLYNSANGDKTFNELGFIKSMYVKFANLRIIREVSSDKKTKYYCAISLERKFESDPKKEYQYDNIIGMDMGEKIPAVIACVNKVTNKIVWCEKLRGEMNGKLIDLQSKKNESQQLNGVIPLKLTNSIKNFTQSLLEDITIIALEKAVRNNALLVTEDLARSFGRGNKKGTYVWMRQYTKLNDLLALKSKELGLIKSDPKAPYTQYGVMAKVPAGYTSKTSIQTGFILRSPYYMSFIDDDFSKTNIIKVQDDIFTKGKNHDRDDSKRAVLTLDIDNLSVYIEWRGKTSKTYKYNGNPEELGSYYASNTGAEKLKDLIKLIRDKENLTDKRKKAILSFIYNLLNPRKTQDTFTDLFTGKSVNSDAQGAINIARSFIYGQSELYKKFVKGKSLIAGEKIMNYQDWYINNLTEVPSFLYK